jgi:hypothetical protein
MSQQNPIDDLFRRRLEDHSVAPPMDLWEGIAQKRDWKHRLLVRLRRNRLWIGLAIAGITTALLIAGWAASEQPVIKSFPIPMPAAQPASLPVAPAQRPQLASENTVDVPARASRQSNASTPESTIAFSIPTDGVPPGDIPATRAATPPPSLLQTAPLPQEPRSNTTAAPPTAMTEDITPKRMPFPALATLSDPFATAPAQELDLELWAKTECADFIDHSVRFSVDILLSPNFALREMEARSLEHVDYARDRENSESPVFAYSASARFSASTRWGLALRTGLTYSQINERFSYLNEQEERIVITNIRDNDGNIIGTDTLVEVGTRRVETNNRYRMLDIPLLAGYEFRHQKFGFSVNGGILLNLLFDQKGDMLSPGDRTPVTFTRGQENDIRPFRDRLALGWYGSVGVTYELDKNLDLLVEPFFRIDPQSFTRSDFILSQRYFTTGLSVGLRKML